MASRHVKREKALLPVGVGGLSSLLLTQSPALRKTFCCSVARGQLRPAYFSICDVDGQAAGQEVGGDGGLHLAL